MADQLVTYELDGAVAVIGLNRADKRNAVNDAVMAQLREAVWRATEEAKAGVIFGHGDNFSAGLDLAEAATWMKPGAPRRKRGRWNRSLDLVARGQIPFIAALKGACIGGGLEIASAAQVRVADTTTFFALAGRPARHLRRRRRFGAHSAPDGLCPHGRPDAHRARAHRRGRRARQPLPVRGAGRRSRSRGRSRSPRASPRMRRSPTGRSARACRASTTCRTTTACSSKA